MSSLNLRQSDSGGGKGVEPVEIDKALKALQSAGVYKEEVTIESGKVLVKLTCPLYELESYGFTDEDAATNLVMSYLRKK